MMLHNAIKPNYSGTIPTLDEYIVVTRTSSGEPRSYIYDEFWDFSGEKNIVAFRNYKVKFAMIKDVSHRVKIQQTLFILTLHDKELSVSKLVSIVSNLHQIYKMIGHSDWHKLSDNLEWTKFKNVLKTRYTSGALEGYNATLNKLVLSGFIDRYIEPNEIRYLGCNNYATQQHIAIPNVFYQKILSHCVGNIEKYHSFRHEISNVMTEAYKLRFKLKSKSYRRTALKISLDNRKLKDIKEKLAMTHNIPDFKVEFTGEWIVGMLVQCIMVCACFSGARIGEILSFNKDSYNIKNTTNGEISIIQGLTTKGNNGEAEITTWQCHPIVKDALELAYDMTSFARDIFRNQVLELFNSAAITEDEYNRCLGVLELSFITPVVTKHCNHSYILPAISVKTNNFLSRLNFKATLTDVEEFNLLNETRVGQLKLNGTLPKLTPHDFRRSFAVFMKRYSLGNAQTIKFQYKHKNAQMSEYYQKNAELALMHDILLDKELIDLMEEEGIRMGIDAYDEIFNKSVHLSGVEGERIINDKIESMKAGRQVYMTRSEISSLVRNGTLSIVMLPTGGYCTNTKCERLCSIKEFISEKSVCQFQIVTDRSAKQQGKYRERLIEKFNLLNNGDKVMNHILSGLKQSILIVEPTLLKHGISYQPFTTKIKGCYDL
jgi:hypothetical protein